MKTLFKLRIIVLCDLSLMSFSGKEMLKIYLMENFRRIGLEKTDFMLYFNIIRHRFWPFKNNFHYVDLQVIVSCSDHYLHS